MIMDRHVFILYSFTPELIIKELLVHHEISILQRIFELSHLSTFPGIFSSYKTFCGLLPTATATSINLNNLD